MSVSKSCQGWFGKVSYSLKDFCAMFFLCSVFGCGQVSSSLCVGLFKLASLEANRHCCFSLSLFWHKKRCAMQSLLFCYFFKLVSSTCGSFAPGCTVCLFVFLMLKLLILLSCNNERYLMQVMKRKFALFFKKKGKTISLYSVQQSIKMPAMTLS